MHRWISLFFFTKLKKKLSLKIHANSSTISIEIKGQKFNLHLISLQHFKHIWGHIAHLYTFTPNTSLKQKIQNKVICIMATSCLLEKIANCSYFTTTIKIKSHFWIFFSYICIYVPNFGGPQCSKINKKANKIEKLLFFSSDKFSHCVFEITTYKIVIH